MKRQIAIFILVNILLQSCVVYQDTSVSLNDAQNQGRVKVTTTYGNDLTLINIDFRDSVYYGDYGKSQDEISLDSAQISSIYLQDVRRSKNQTTITIVSLVIGIPLIVIIGTIIAIDNNGIY